MRRVLIVVLGCSIAFGCGRTTKSKERAPAAQPSTPGSRASATDTGFASRAPENTRLLGRTDLSLPPWRAELWDGVEQMIAEEARSAGLPATSFDQCGIDTNTAIGVIEVAIAEPFRVLAEVRGTLSTKALACLFGFDAESGQLTLDEIVVTDLPAGGLRIANYQPTTGKGAPEAIQRRFQSLVESYPTAIVTSLGPDAARIDVSFVQDKSVSRFDILVPDAQQADAAHAWLVEAMALAATEDHRVSQVKIQRQQRRLIIESPPSAELPPAIKATVLQGFNMPSAGMLPTLEIGDHFYVAKGALAGTAARGDIVVFQAPGSGTLYVKRAIGVGGDKIALKSGQLYLNGQRVPARKIQDDYEIEDIVSVTNERYTLKRVLWTESLEGREYQILTINRMSSRPDGEWTVPDDHVFVMGDNRDNSADSRSFGTIPRSSIVGHVTVLWMSMGPDGIRWDRIGRVVR